MKIQILCGIAVLGLVSGCAWSGKHTGASDYNDQNVLTGGPAVGMTIKDLPQTVKATLQKKAPTAEISDIERQNMSGKTVYKISFLDPTKNPTLWVADDGDLVPLYRKDELGRADTKLLFDVRARSRVGVQSAWWRVGGRASCNAFPPVRGLPKAVATALTSVN